MQRPALVIVTPGLADANNGNGQTARRWSRMLATRYRVRVAPTWDGGDDVLMIALHARRSAASVAAWKAARPSAPAILVLTGTDLYRDIDDDPEAQASLQRADRLIVLNQLGARALPEALRGKARVVLQSCPARRHLAKATTHQRAVMVGHLREEKSPRTYFEAARRLHGRGDILLDHIGSALDPALGREAQALATHCPNYRWLGGLPYATTRKRIQTAHVLVHPSRIEGGAHVVIEAVRSGTPVLASRIDGNVGLLGEDYRGYFGVDQADALATLLQRLRDEPDTLADLHRQCVERAALFDPERESEALHAQVRECLLAPHASPLPTTPST